MFLKRKKMNLKRKGFTLVELIWVMVAIGILAAIIANANLISVDIMQWENQAKWLNSVIQNWINEWSNGPAANRVYNNSNQIAFEDIKSNLMDWATGDDPIPSQLIIDACNNLNWTDENFASLLSNYNFCEPLETTLDFLTKFDWRNRINMKVVDNIADIYGDELKTIEWALIEPSSQERWLVIWAPIGTPSDYNGFNEATMIFGSQWEYYLWYTTDVNK